MPSEPKEEPTHPGTCERCRKRPGMARNFGAGWLCDDCAVVSVPEERQEKLPQTEEEWRTYVMMQGEIIKARAGLGEYAQQPRESVLKSALDALAVAVKPVQEQWAAQLNVRTGDMDALLSAITALLDGRTTT